MAQAMVEQRGTEFAEQLHKSLVDAEMDTDKPTLKRKRAPPKKKEPKDDSLQDVTILEGEKKKPGPKRKPSPESNIEPPAKRQKVVAKKKEKTLETRVEELEEALKQANYILKEYDLPTILDRLSALENKTPKGRGKVATNFNPCGTLPPCLNPSDMSELISFPKSNKIKNL
jgi:hypothetical protein